MTEITDIATSQNAVTSATVRKSLARPLEFLFLVGEIRDSHESRDLLESVDTVSESEFRTGQEVKPMTIVFILLALLACCIPALILVRRRRATVETARFSVTAAELRSELERPNHVLLLDVRHPLDLLADPHIIPGSVRMEPKAVQSNPALVPFDKDIVFYCTCPSDKTSRDALRKAHESKHDRVKFLRGGLAAWKELGLPVETYETAFHLDTATSD